MSWIGDGSTYFTGTFAAVSSQLKPVSILTWYKQSVTASAVQGFAQLGSSASATGMFGIRTNTAETNMVVDDLGATAFTTTGTTPTIPNGTWLPFVGTSDNATLRTSYSISATDRGGIPSTANAGSATYDRVVIGAKSQAGGISSQLRAGNQLAEVAIWIGVSLGLSEVADLLNGENPFNVRNDFLQFYFPLISDMNNATGFAFNLAQAGSASPLSWGDHPPVAEAALNVRRYFLLGGSATYTLTGPSSGTVGLPSGNFTATPPGGGFASQTIVTPNDGANGGAFAPSSLSFAAGSTAAQTFTYTPATTGAKLIATTNNQSLSNPAPVTYTSVAASATSYSLTGPSAGTTGAPSANFTVTPNGTAASTIIVTPATTGSGTFTPATVSFSAGSSAGQTFTYIANASATASISTSNNGGLTNPSPISYTSSGGVSGRIAVNDPAFLWSPRGWRGSTSQTDAVYRQTPYSGAWFEIVVNAGPSPTLQFNFGKHSVSNYYSVYVNQVRTKHNIAIGASDPAALTTADGLVANAPNLIRFAVSGDSQTNTWLTPTNVVQITGVTLDSGSRSGTSRALGPWGVFFGDSLTQGVYANYTVAHVGPPFVDTQYGWADAVGKAFFEQFGYDYAIAGFGSNGWLALGYNNDIPAFYSVSGGVYSDANSRWNKISAGVSCLDSNGHMSAYGGTGTEPSYIVVHLGTNDGAAFQSGNTDLSASILGGLTALRSSAPNAWIFLVLPFCAHDLAVTAAGAQMQSAYAGVKNSNFSTDARMVYVDLGADLSFLLSSSTGASDSLLYTGSHTMSPGAAVVAPQLAIRMAQHLLGGG